MWLSLQDAAQVCGQCGAREKVIYGLCGVIAFLFGCGVKGISVIWNNAKERDAQLNLLLNQALAKRKGESP